VPLLFAVANHVTKKREQEIPETWDYLHCLFNF